MKTLLPATADDASAISFRLFLPSSHRIRPFTSYDRTLREPTVTISVRTSLLHVGRRPVRFLVARDTPELGAGACVEGRRKRSFFVVVHHVDPAIVQRRRSTTASPMRTNSSYGRAALERPRE